VKTARYATRYGRRARRQQYERSGAIWTPLDIAGLALWLDNQLITEAGGLVTAWPDLSGLGNHGAQSNPALQGDYEATGWNGTQPCVLINGETSGEYYTFDAGTLPGLLSGDDTPFTITLVCQVTSNPTGSRDLLAAGSSSSANPWLRLNISASDQWGMLRRDGSSVSSNAVEAVASFDANRHQFTMHFDGAISTLYKDGVSIAANAAGIGACSFDRFTLGMLRRAVADNNGVNFRTPGMTIYNRALSAPELALLWQYNRDHFGGLP
jgi:hypothetical protein